MLLRLSHNNRGFTLIELMVVIIILGILAMWVAPKIMSRPEQAKQVKTQLDIQNLETALKLYKLDNGSYPSTEQGLEALVTRPNDPTVRNWKPGGYMDRVPTDPWGNAFAYESPSEHGDYAIMSYGADGSPGGEDVDTDIVSWKDIGQEG